MYTLYVGYSNMYNINKADINYKLAYFVLCSY